MKNQTWELCSLEWDLGQPDGQKSSSSRLQYMAMDNLVFLILLSPLPESLVYMNDSKGCTCGTC